MLNWKGIHLLLSRKKIIIMINRHRWSSDVRNQGGKFMPVNTKKVSYLKQIQSNVTKYAEVIAGVLKVDVEIVDSNLEKISGTGLFKNDVNDYSKGRVYQSILKEGVHRIIQFPRENELCQLCDARGTCIETMEIATPIKFEKKNIGVIGLVCTTDEQKRYINENLDSHLEFLMQISDLITSKVLEYKNDENNLQSLMMLENILDHIENGVIGVNQKNKITYINEEGKRKLKVSDNLINQDIHIDIVASGIGDSDQYSVGIKDSAYQVMGRLVDLKSYGVDYSKILIFSTLKDVRKKAYAMTTGTRLLALDSIIGESAAMREIKNKITKVAQTDSTVLIRGESGTGKELIARAIHSESARRDQPFVGINCAAIPNSLIESELFGYAKGAFSGASTSGRMGKFELANKGVLFLDEIGDMPLYLQSKILRILQERVFSRVGSNDTIELDIRVVAATNRNLEEMIRKNEFRRDLFYRLNVIPMNVPPLREREDDLKLLIDSFLEKYNDLFGRNIKSIDKEAYKSLKKYRWPGNVRELENTIQYLVTLADSSKVIKKFTLPDSILYEVEETAQKIDKYNIKPLKQVEDEHIRKVLELYGDSTEGKKKAAKVLGIGIATLYRKHNEIYQNDK